MFNVKKIQIGKFLFFGMFLVCSLISKAVCANQINDYIYRCGFRPANEEVRPCVILPILDRNIRYPRDFSYDGGRPSMVIIHETANDLSTIEGEITFMTRNQENAFVHSFTDANRVITVAKPDYKAWGAGANGNKYGIQIENVRVHSKDDFAKELTNCAAYTARYLHRYGLGAPRLITSGTKPFGGGNLASHSMISRIMGETDHADPDWYWADRASTFFGTGYNMYDFRDLVQYFYDKFTPLQPVSIAEKFQRVTRNVNMVNTAGERKILVLSGTQREFVGKFKLNGVLHYVTNWGKNQGNWGIPASALESVIKPLDSSNKKVMKLTQTVNRKDILGNNTDIVSSGVQREFVGRYMINGTWYYITRWSRDNGRLDGIPMSALRPTLEILRAPELKRVRNRIVRKGPGGEAVDVVVAGTKRRFVARFKLGGTFYYVTEWSMQGRMAGVIESNLDSGAVVTSIAPRLMRLNQDVSRVDSLGDRADFVAKGIERKFVAKFTRGRQDYYVTEWSRNRGSNEGIPFGNLRQVS